MTVDQPSWELDAACVDHPDPDLWFPEDGEGLDNHGTTAKRICAACPALVPCLEAAVDRDEEFGIWGGAGGMARRHLRRARLSGSKTAWTVALAAHIGRLDGNVTEAFNANGAGATHGLEATYAKGCRCEPCCLAIADRGHSVVVADGDRTAVGPPASVTTFTGKRTLIVITPTTPSEAA